LAANQTRRAIERVDQQIAREPGRAEFRQLLAEIFTDHGDYASAEDAYRKALEQDPQNAETALALSNLYIKRGELQKAVALYEGMLKTDPMNAATKKRLATILLNQAPVRAGSLANEAIQADPQDTEARVIKGRSLLAESKVSQAITELETATTADRASPAARFFLGVAYRQNNKPGEAEAAWNEALKLNPRFAQARLALA